jgi:hypothetical protein
LKRSILERNVSHKSRSSYEIAKHFLRMFNWIFSLNF